MSNIWLIVAREFNERVRKKSFIVTTLLMPVLMLGLMLAPALMMRYASGQTKTIVVIDRSGLVAQHLESSDEVRFETSDLPVDTALRVMIDKFGVLCIGADVLTNPSDVKLYANSASSMMLEENLRGQIAKVLEREKLRAYRIEDLDRILADVKTDVKMQVVRNDEGSPSSGSSAVAAMVGLGLGMVLYMFLMIYGAMVMQSVIEEKSSRVLEVVVSSVRPFELMMGKIFGVASVAVVQVLIWAVLVCGAGAAVMPHVLPDGAMEAAAALQQGGGAATAAAGDFDPETLGAIALATDVGYLAMLFGYLLLFVVGGYLLYSAMFAAVGSAVDNAQDAAQLQTPIMIPHHSGRHRRDVGAQRPQFAARVLVLAHPLHFARGDDGAHSLRHPDVGDRPLARAALRRVRGDGVALGQDLPRGDLHVRQETDAARDVPVDSLQILIRNQSKYR